MFIFIEGIKLPVNPEEIKLEDKQGIETVAIIDTGNVPLVGNPELQSIEFESFMSSFEFEGSIEDSANIVRLIQENKETKKREVYIYQDSYNIGAWGKLQYMKKVDEKATEGQIKQWGEMLLKMKNRPKETFSLKADIGSIDFLAGHAVYVDVKDIEKKGWYVIEEATHSFSAEKHTMEIKLFMAGSE